MRIVSLLPSATEILHALGAGEHLVGVTFECDTPEQARRDARIVSTSALPAGLGPGEIDQVVRARLEAGEDLYRLDQRALADLRPDLIVTQDLCAVCAVDVDRVHDALDFLGCSAQVLTTDPSTLEEVWLSIEHLGAATGRLDAAARLATSLRARIEAVRAQVRGRPRRACLVLEWTDPPFAPGHWVPEMVDSAGGRSVLGEAAARSRPTTWRSVTAAEPAVIVVAPCGYALPAAREVALELVSQEVLPEVPVWAVDANASFARPGPRLADGVEALARILHPELGPPDPAMASRLR